MYIYIYISELLISRMEGEYDGGVTRIVYACMPYAPKRHNGPPVGPYLRAPHPRSPNGPALMGHLQGPILRPRTSGYPHGLALMGRP